MNLVQAILTAEEGDVVKFRDLAFFFTRDGLLDAYGFDTAGIHLVYISCTEWEVYHAEAADDAFRDILVTAQKIARDLSEGHDHIEDLNEWKAKMNAFRLLRSNNIGIQPPRGGKE
jgi:hypothetical protein